VNATHGMVLFGKEKLMAYHLPMFHNIHAYQVIFEYEVPADIKEKIIAASEDNYLTFVPAPFGLEDFMANPHEIKGDVYSGHFEKDGVLFLSNVTLMAPKMIYNAGIKKPMPRGNNFNTYKLVGTPTDLYFIHLLEGGDPVDQIFKAALSIPTPQQTALAQTALNNEGNSYLGIKLLSEKDNAVLMVDYINKKDPKCHPLITRACQVTQMLTLSLTELLFTDFVM
jgi:hypothetical protein